MFRGRGEFTVSQYLLYVVTNLYHAAAHFDQCNSSTMFKLMLLRTHTFLPFDTKVKKELEK